MITPEELTEPAVRAFVTALVGQDADAFRDAVTERFTYSSEDESADADEFLATRSTIVLHDQSPDGMDLTGLAVRRDLGITVRWVFSVTNGKVRALAVASDVELPNTFWDDAAPALEKASEAPSKPAGKDFQRPVGPDGESHPRGALRVQPLGDTWWVHRWGPTGRGSAGWTYTGEKAPNPVHAAFRSPASGRHDDRGHIGGVSSVSSDLTVELRWDNDGYQRAAVSFTATPYMWESVCWLGENLELVDQYVPTLKGTLTLTGPDHTVVSTELITVKGGKPPYGLPFTRNFPLKELPTGTYTLAFTDGVKTGGRRSTDGKNNTGKDEVRLRDHVLTFTVGG